VHLRVEQPIEEEVAIWRAITQSPQQEHRVQAEPTRRYRSRTRVVGLHATAGDHSVCTPGKRVSKQPLELANFVPREP
jgi:hypothetical protein